jgi:hypothetical protein
MTVVIHILEAWAALLVAFLLWRAWAGGCFDTGLEKVFGFSKAHEDESWCSPDNDEFRNYPISDCRP